ncbi:MAG: sigma-54-dependent Fis family transcriptional regulator [Thermoanaerobaculaceae bacterium]|nr:sigma-54-dependent Fis family transcriptional regulator [Thermoanaerobaculaceae bacterium]MDI9623158.1 sigma-54 dependent transcriptional regulator [Acidobacteriota bacterium]NLH09969.1 sigma-54-dependent Fis family transcriptional regulator [Holophagae bacterium]
MRVLIVDDEPVLQDVLSTLLRREGFDVAQAQTAAEALRLADEVEVDLVLLDLMLPDRPGMEILRELKTRDPEVVVIVITAYSSVETAITAMRDGAFHYIPKPFKNQEVILTVRKGLEQRRLRTENRVLRQRLAGLENFVWRSPAMERVIELVRRAAPSRSNVLLTGESGTGKELLARATHHLSARADGPFVVVNTGSVPSELLESTLFGHVRGAFTGAVANRRGLFEVAEGGTIFLDEIGTIALATQAKLLRVIQEREFIPVGGEHNVKVDVRIIAATNADLPRMVTEGTFREDLYYRLNVITIQLPPLRQRREDVAALANHFLRRFADENEKPFRTLTPRALDLLVAYAWPGNVRQLENVIERAVVLCQEDVIDIDLFPVELLFPQSGLAAQLPEDGLDLREAINGYTRALIEASLSRCGGIQRRAAQMLRVSPSTLNEMIRRLGMSASED